MQQGSDIPSFRRTSSMKAHFQRSGRQGAPPLQLPSPLMRSTCGEAGGASARAISAQTARRAKSQRARLSASAMPPVRKARCVMSQFIGVRTSSPAGTSAAYGCSRQAAAARLRCWPRPCGEGFQDISAVAAGRRFWRTQLVSLEAAQTKLLVREQLQDVRDVGVEVMFDFVTCTPTRAWYMQI